MLINGKEVDIACYCNQEGGKFNVVSEVHNDDFIFRFCVEHECFKDLESAISYYFSTSDESAEKLAALISSYCNLEKQSFNLLEFASGYGAVTRHFKNRLTNVTVTSCDIHKEATTFIQNKLGVEAVLSESIPENLKLTKSFDVVFALSFFSHMPKKTWSRWLSSLAAQVENGGYLIFTAHGKKSLTHFGDPEVEDDGFWFQLTSEQKDLDSDEYGMTVTLPKYVKSEIKLLPEFTLIHFEEGYWWEHQDVYILRKAQEC